MEIVTIQHPNQNQYIFISLLYLNFHVFRNRSIWNQLKLSDWNPIYPETLVGTEPTKCCDDRVPAVTQKSKPSDRRLILKKNRYTLFTSEPRLRMSRRDSEWNDIETLFGVLDRVSRD